MLHLFTFVSINKRQYSLYDGIVKGKAIQNIDQAVTPSRASTTFRGTLT
jgi:hypothetical protein